MKKLQVLAAVLIVLVAAASYAAEQDEWKADFDRLCGVTDMAHTFSADELRSLVVDCDRLMATLEKVNPPKKKLYLFRLKKCRNLFSFMLSTKEAEKK